MSADSLKLTLAQMLASRNQQIWMMGFVEAGEPSFGYLQVDEQKQWARLLGQRAVKTFRAMVFGVGLGLETVEGQSRLAGGTCPETEFWSWSQKRDMNTTSDHPLSVRDERRRWRVKASLSASRCSSGRASSYSLASTVFPRLSRE